MYLVFTRTPGENYRRRLRSLLLCLCDVFRPLINSHVCLFFHVFSFSLGSEHQVTVSVSLSFSLALHFFSYFVFTLRYFFLALSPPLLLSFFLSFPPLPLSLSACLYFWLFSTFSVFIVCFFAFFFVLSF